MKMKRMICLLLAVAMILPAGCSKKKATETPKATEESAPTFKAENYTKSGKTDNAVEWGFDEETGELAIGGEGDLIVIPEPDEDTEKYPNGKLPWSDYEIKKITVFSGVTSICGEAFMGIDTVEVVDLPATVTDIGDRAFASCAALKEINVSKDNPNYMSAGGVLFTKDAKVLVQYPVGKGQTTYEIPEGVETIGTMAFANCGDTLNTVTIPSSVTWIGEGAFLFCRVLESVAYGGTEAEWKSVKVEKDNDLLKFATFYFK